MRFANRNVLVSLLLNHRSRTYRDCIFQRLPQKSLLDLSLKVTLGSRNSLQLYL